MCVTKLTAKLTSHDKMNFYTCLCPKCRTLINYYIFSGYEEVASLTCKVCEYSFNVGINGKILGTHTFERTEVYARGGRGNPKLVGLSTGNNDNYFSMVGYHKGSIEQKQHIMSDQPRVITRPRTVIRLGRWIRSTPKIHACIFNVG